MPDCENYHLNVPDMAIRNLVNGLRDHLQTMVVTPGWWGRLFRRRPYVDIPPDVLDSRLVNLANDLQRVRGINDPAKVTGSAPADIVLVEYNTVPKKTTTKKPAKKKTTRKVTKKKAAKKKTRKQ